MDVVEVGCVGAVFGFVFAQLIVEVDTASCCAAAALAIEIIYLGKDAEKTLFILFFFEMRILKVIVPVTQIILVCYKSKVFSIFDQVANFRIECLFRNPGDAVFRDDFILIFVLSQLGVLRQAVNE